MGNNLRTGLGTFASHPPIYKNITKHCKFCGAELQLRNNRDIERRNYCSHHCRAKGAARTEAFSINKMRSCCRCGTQYLATKGAQKYCSVQCTSAAAESAYKQRWATPEGWFKRLLRTNHRRNKITHQFLMLLYARQGGRCALSGVPMTTIAEKGHVLTNVSIDRIDSSKGYFEENIQLVCHIVNLMKHNMTVNQLREWCRKIMENSNS